MPKRIRPACIPGGVILAKARELDRAGRQEEAETAFRMFLDREPDHAEAWADFGGLLMVMGRLEEAEQACRRALQIDPDLALGMVNLAHTLLHLDRVDEAQRLSLCARQGSSECRRLAVPG